MTQIRINNYAKALRAMLMSTAMLMTNTVAMAGVVIHGSVYGGGNLADVKTNTTVNMGGGTVAGNVYGGGKGSDYNYLCDKAMVGVIDDGITVTVSNGKATYTLLDGGTTVNITGGTVGTPEGEEGSQTLKEGTGNVYGGGEIGRVERNTQVTIGSGANGGAGTQNGTPAPIILGSVFGAGAGNETHGYSALVRGNSTVIIQGNAKVQENVYGGGEKATAGRYWVKGFSTPNEGETMPTAPTDLSNGMPYKTRCGGVCSVTVRGYAQIGPNANASDDAGHVYGAGKGIDSDYQSSGPNKSQKMTPTGLADFIDENGKTARENYFEFLQTLALATETHVTISGSAQVKGNVYGGSESGFVQDDTDVKIQKGTIGTTNSYGNVFGGGKGLATFAEAGKVKGNTGVDISGGTMHGTVYGGGELGHVGTFSYVVNPQTGSKTYTWTEGGTCIVTIDALNDNTTSIKGNVFGAGKGSSAKYECEPAMVLQSNVTINNGTVDGTVYGGGEIGRVDQNTTVTIGKSEDNTSEPDIKGGVFGAGAGKETHGYSALVRGNSTVTVQGKAKVGKSVYGGGETASVGRFVVVNSLPKQPVSGGICTVTIKDNATIGTSSTGGNVYGACKGVEPDYDNATGHVTDDENLTEFVDEDDYLSFLKTLALTSNTEVNISGSGVTVNGSVYGGGQRGVTLAGVKVNITGGTVTKDVYGGGALANTNTENWDDTNNTLTCYHVETRLTRPTYQVKEVEVGVSVEGLYIKEDDEYNPASGTAIDGTAYYEKVSGSSVAGYYTKSGNEYTLLTSGTADENTTYYRLTDTKVYLLGGTIKGDAYGGGLGRLGEAVVGEHYTAEDEEVIAGTKSTDDWKVEPVAAADGNGSVKATVYGDIAVQLGDDAFTNATSFWTTYDTDDQSNSVVKSGRVFGCNNLNGSPKGNVTVTVWRTVPGKDADGNTITKTPSEDKKKKDESLHKYELAAVYGGGNLASYTAIGKKTHVIIHGCDYSSILTVYGGGNAAPVPETDVDINSCYEIGSVFGGGNGKDKYTTDGGTTWKINPGANVGTEAQPGNANTMIYGGTVHEAYGASNEKGTVYGNVVIDVGQNQPGETCTLDVAKLVGAGKNADVNGNLILVMGCKPNTQIPLVYGGADNANVNGNVELTVTSGWFGKVFGGNNESGAIRGHIKLNIEETGTCDTPIKIEELYLGGNEAAYSVYGYYVKTRTDVVDSKKILKGDPNDPEEIPVLKNGKLIFLPRLSADDSHLPVKSYTFNETQNKWTWEVYPGTYDSTNKKWNWEVSSSVYKDVFYEQPVLNIISCTRIGAVFGGGLGETAIMCADPTVNINMEPGALANQIDRDGVEGADNDPTLLGEIGGKYINDKDEEVDGGVYGGGNAAAVYGNTTVNIGTETEVQMTSVKDENGVLLTTQPTHTVTGAYIVGNVYGGGKLADVGKTHLGKDDDGKDIDVIDIDGSTFVNIGAVQGSEILDAQSNPTGRYNYTSVSFAEGAPGITIGGNVYGGGKGEALESGEGAFRCAKAMVTKHTNVAIGNGTIGDGAATHGHVYGGGEKGRVQENTTVTIGCENDANSKPVITGNVFGSGRGVNSHGYSALTRGNSYVTVQGEAKVKMSVYGGGEIASVGKYNVNAQGLPESLANQNSGYCTVIVRDNAVIGPDAAMVMTATGYPDDKGHVFGGGKGVLPYEGYADNVKAWRVTPGNAKQEYLSKNEAIDGTDESGYLPYVETLGLATQTYVTIDENAFVKGSVYGGSENGYVQHDTQVNIRGNCQIGNGYVQMADNGTYLATANMRGVNRRYTAKEWEEGHLFVTGDTEVNASDPTEAALRTDVSTNYTSSLPECASWPYGQASGTAKYAPWDMYDGTSNYDSKGGRTTADDGHTFYGNVFGGGSGVIPYRPGKWHPEAGSVGGNTVINITGGHILTNIYGGNELTDVYGKCTVNFGGTATLGVPRTPKQIAAHPLTCYLFGAGKGDQRVLFNKKTNVDDVEVNITGGWIYGSVFGGGEDGHVHHNVTMTISEADYATDNTKTRTKIGTWGTTYVDGNVFGGGRGFGADAYTAGNVAGTVTMNILGGTMLGSIYGGGRLGSVGYGLFDEGADGYGEMCDDNISEDSNPISADNFKRGYVYMTIGNNDGTGPTIGNTWEYKIPSASNGPMTTGEDPVPTLPSDIKTWTAANWTTWREYNHVPKTEFEYNESKGYYMLTHTKGGNVFAGGMGNFYKQDGSTYINGVDWWKLGNVKSTTLTIKGGTIKSNVYGGGELGQVVGSHTTKNSANQDINAGTEITIQGSSTTIGTPIDDGSTVQYTFGSVFGGGYGSLLEKITHTGGKPDSYPKYIAGRVKAGTKVNMTAGTVLASVYGGGEMAAVGESTILGETLTTGYTGDTHVMVSGGIIGKNPITLSGNSIRYFGGAKMGNVYGGGSGHNNTVRSGHVYGNTNVTINAGSVSGEPKIYHNVYGGGAYGSVGDFTYQTGTDAQTGTQKVIGISDLNEEHPNSGVARVTITGGTIGYDGKENGMVFGSSRGDINQPGERDDHTAWVYDTHVTIGTAGTPASGSEEEGNYVAATPATGPSIKGSVYGSGENGHVFNNTVVTVNGGTIGISDSTDPGYTVTSNNTEYSGAAYPYRGNVYGGGCGTDMYYSGDIPAGHTYNDGEGDSFNALAGIVYGTTTVTINDGHVVRNVYGAGAMGSVGRTVTTTANNVTTTTYNGGTTTINISGGTIGYSGTVGDGNVFGAARGDLSATGDYISQVRETNVTVSGGTVKGNVYGGGELGDVGTIDKSDQTDYNYNWKDKDGNANTHCNNTITGTNNNTGICTVTVSGGTIGTDATTMNADGSFDNGNVFGGGKGSGTTWWCEKAIAYSTNVTITAGTVKGSVYGGGEVGRVEDDAKVTIGLTETDAPTINGSVFGAGKGLKTHGYSALVRGNADVIVQGKSVIEGSVFGGGEIASVGKFYVDKGLPKKPLNGGTCTVRIQDEAKIGSSGTGHNVFGACKGVKSTFDLNNYKNFKSMQTEANGAKGTKGTDWDYYDNYPETGYTGHKFVWKYYKTEADYLAFLRTLALTSNTHVTIDEDATVYGSVFGGGERGVTLGGVDVNIVGGSVKDDVYGGGSLANSNAAMWDTETNKRVAYVELDKLIPGTSATGYYSSQSPNALITATDATVQPNTTYYAIYKTNVNLTGGTVGGNVYGGGLGQLAKDAINYTAEEATAYNTAHNLNENDADFKTTASVKEAALSDIKAKVYGDVLVKLNETTASNDCKVKGTIFGCNNLNGSPQSAVTVHIYKTADYDGHEKGEKNDTKYNVEAVYGGGNLAAFIPDYKPVADTAVVRVIIDGCGLTSIKTVYGGGNAASVPATEVTVNGTYEIGQVFGGGNGADNYQLDDIWYLNPGANVGYLNYTHWEPASVSSPGTENEPYYLSVNNTATDEATDPNNKDASSKEKRIANYAYGIGKTHVTINRGTVHEVYGGSNSRGNVRVEARTTLEDLTTSPDDDDCPFDVGEAYGGGRNAPMDGDAVLEIGCISGLEKAYGGAANADVNGNVVLNITNGTYDQVFGGNDAGGAIRGSITVNIEETGCRPIIIGELYGGGNLAPYSVYGYNDDGTLKESGSKVADPQVNVKSFTSIGNIFGGGYGADAVMVGDPYVNINVAKGKFSNYVGDPSKYGEAYPYDAKGYKGQTLTIGSGEEQVSVTVPAHRVKLDESNNPVTVNDELVGTIGVINNVFGGGNAAAVIGTPHVNIGTLTGEPITLVTKSIEDSEGRTPSEAEWTPSYQIATVEGVDIRGNVYGAGNNASVTGNTDVVIGKNNAVKTYSFTSYSSDGTNGTVWSSGLAQTTGVTKNDLAEVMILTNGKYGLYVGQKFYVDPAIKPDGTERKELKKNENGTLSNTGLYVAIKPFEQKKTYKFTSSDESGSTTYSTGTATSTGNFKNFSGTDYMQIVVLTNPGFESWVGKTFYVPVDAKTDGTKYQLRKANGTTENVWVSISE